MRAENWLCRLEPLSDAACQEPDVGAAWRLLRPRATSKRYQCVQRRIAGRSKTASDGLEQGNLAALDGVFDVSRLPDSIWRDSGVLEVGIAMYSSMAMPRSLTIMALGAHLPISI